MFLKTIKGVKVSPLLLKNFAKLSTNSCCKYKLTYSIFTSDKSFFLNKNLANRFTILKSFWITNFKSDEINITAWVLLNWSQSSTSKNLVIKSKHIFLMDKSSSSKQPLKALAISWGWGMYDSFNSLSFIIYRIISPVSGFSIKYFPS